MTPKPRHPLRRISQKKLASLGGIAPRSTVTGPRKPIKKKSRPAKETERIYGGAERIAFVKSLPCAACGIRGYSEVAHAKSGGMGRKDDATGTLPLCGPHPIRGNKVAIVEGCHGKLHRVGRMTFESVTNCHLETAAAQCEIAWRRVLGGGGE